MNIQDRIHQAMLTHPSLGEDSHLEADYEDRHGYPEEDFTDEEMVLIEMFDPEDCWPGDDL